MARNVTKSGAPRVARDWTGPILLSYGFRPFFLFAPLLALLAMINWLFLLNGGGIEPAALSTLDWHIHEMLFGYTSAAIAGFLLTAVPNWTGRLPVFGWPLLGLAAVWLAGRLAMLSPWALPYGLAPAIDAAFLPYLAAIIGREVVSGKNWRNIKVLVPILVLAGANIWFQISASTAAGSAGAIRLGFAAILFLLMLIGGRIIPSFTRNWLARQEPGHLPAPFNRFDALVLAVSVVGLLGWVVNAPSVGLAGVLAVAGIAQAVRLSRWAGLRCISNPLLIVLHVFYAFIPLGFLTLAGAVAMDDAALNTSALHLFGAGAIGGMTMAVMLRATLGHTGRALLADRAMSAMLVLLGVAALTRAVAAVVPAAPWLITLAGLIWIAGFGLFAFKVGPWLLTPRLRKSD